MNIAETVPAFRHAIVSEADETERAIVALWPTAYRIAKLVLRDHMAAEDVAQESVVRALAKRRQLRDPKVVEPWFRALVTRRALSARRGIERRRGREGTIDEQHEPVASFDGTGAVDVGSAIERLPDDVRLAVILVYFGGFTSVEAGKLLTIAPATVRYRLAAARSLLRPLLESDHA